MAATDENISRYFFDTEFYHTQAQGFKLELISLGIVEQGGHEFYAENADFDENLCADDHWMQDNVISHLGPPDKRLHLDDIRQGVLDLVTPSEEAHFWLIESGGHDAFALTSLFGGIVGVRSVLFHDKGIKRVRFKDITQIHEMFNDHAMPQQDKNMVHNALNDAKHVKDVYDHIRALSKQVDNISLNL